MTTSAEVLEQRAGISRQSVLQSSHCCGNNQMKNPRKGHVPCAFYCVKLLHVGSMFGPQLFGAVLWHSEWKRGLKWPCPLLHIEEDKTQEKDWAAVAQSHLAEPVGPKCQCTLITGNCWASFDAKPNRLDNMVKLSKRHCLLLNRHLFCLKKCLRHDSTQTVSPLRRSLIP